MKLFTFEGIVFRTVKYGESSLILDVYTLEKGLSSFIVSGVRSSKSRFKANLYHPSNIIEFAAYHAEHNKLSRIKESHLKYKYHSISGDVVKSSVLTFLTEVARNSIVERESNSEFYLFLVDWFLFLENITVVHPCLHHRFMIELSSFLGFEPMNNRSKENVFFDLNNGAFSAVQQPRTGLGKEESKIWHQLIVTPREKLTEITVSSGMRKMILHHLIDYYRLHLSYFKEVVSLKVLTEVFT